MTPLVPAGLIAVVEANAPYWAGEAEICRTYFESPARTAESDLLWLTRQAAKEIIDGVQVRAAELERLLADASGPFPTEALLRTTEELHEEAVHYRAFAAAHESIRQTCNGERLAVAALRAAVAWAENLALRDLRAAQRAEHGEIGQLAGLFTEGGYCTLFAEGMRLKGRGGADDDIAAACALVHDDEFDHMLASVLAVGDERLDDREWEFLAELTVAQSQLRLAMRDAQFGGVVGEERLRALQAGGATPLAFDWDRACAQVED